MNLYPFKEKIKEPNTNWDTAIENIDIGGPAMLRSAAKNHHSVAAIVAAFYGKEAIAAKRNDSIQVKKTR